MTKLEKELNNRFRVVHFMGSYGYRLIDNGKVICSGTCFEMRRLKKKKIKALLPPEKIFKKSCTQLTFESKFSPFQTGSVFRPNK